MEDIIKTDESSLRFCDSMEICAMVEWVANHLPCYPAAEEVVRAIYP